MEKNSRTHIYIVLGFAVALISMTGLIFFDGYFNVHAAGESTFVEVSDEFVDASNVPDLFSFLTPRQPQQDFTSDDSFQKYLSDATAFNDLTYVPTDLAPVNSNFTANDPRHFKLRQEAGDMFADMAWHFRDDFKGDRLAIFSAYRSKSYQDGLLRKGCSTNACAKGGTSEHQAGLAVDLRVVTKGGKSISLDKPNKYTDRLHAHAQEWGFHNTYQKGVAIDGKIVEGRHWRYMGVKLASLLAEKGMTFAEYYKQITDNG